MEREPKRIEIEGTIPAFIWHAEGSDPRPVIVWPGTKNDVDPEALRAALAADITVLAYDMYLFGDRQPAGFKPPERVDLTDFLVLAEQGVRDLEAVLRHLRGDGGIDGTRVGLRAISLGASFALAAIAHGLKFRACLSICGAGDFAASAAWRMQRDGVDVAAGAAHSVARSSSLVTVFQFLVVMFIPQRRSHRARGMVVRPMPFGHQRYSARPLAATSSGINSLGSMTASCSSVGALDKKLTCS